MKRTITLVLALMLALMAAGSANAAEETSTQRAASLGGAAGQINVLLGERCITFTDAVPEARDGRTMVPMRAALEAMGAVVDYDAATLTASVTSERASFTHRIGSREIVLADGTTVTMDTASYVTPTSRTMVPVRFFSQVLGYDVFWDGECRTVFLLDPARWIDELDANFTILNDYLAKSASRFDGTQNRREELTLSGEAVYTDATGAVRRSECGAALSVLTGSAGANLTLRADLGELGTLLANAFGGEHGAQYGASLADLSLDAIYGDRLYVRSPLLDAFAVGIGAHDGTWYVASNTGAAAASILDGSTVGAICYEALAHDDDGSFYEAYRALRALEKTLPAVLGDETFTGTTTRTRTLGTDELAALLTALTGEAYTADRLAQAGLSDWSAELKLYSADRASLRYVLTAALNADAALKLDCTVSGTAERSSVKGTAALGDITMTFRGTTTVRASDETIATAPLEPEHMVDLTH